MAKTKSKSKGKSAFDLESMEIRTEIVHDDAWRLAKIIDSVPTEIAHQIIDAFFGGDEDEEPSPNGASTEALHLVSGDEDDEDDSDEHETVVSEVPANGRAEFDLDIPTLVLGFSRAVVKARDEVYQFLAAFTDVSWKEWGNVPLKATPHILRTIRNSDEFDDFLSSAFDLAETIETEDET